MTVRALDDSGDIVTSGLVSQQFISEQAEIAQTINTRLKLFYGEYFRDITDGTPWFQSILGKGTDQSTREALLKSRIAESPGVIRLIAFSFDFDISTRAATVTASVLTQYGILALEYTN